MATQKQKRAVELMVENGRNVSKAMRDAGYSEQTAVVPQKLTQSKGFKEILAEAGITDEYLSKKHRKLLDSKREEIVTKNLDLAYKVKGHFAPEKISIKLTTVDEVKKRIENLKKL